ncbi:MAG: DinB family protein [Blastocatellia bacterium]|nr:DinB family protein [Blastocatellia bacterium]
MTEKDRELAISQLNGSREKFVAAVAGLSEAQLRFKSAPDRWSIAEVAEHITVAEDLFFNTLTEKGLKSPLTPEKERKIKDEQLLTMVTNRSTKFQAPEPLKPAGRWASMTEIMQEFDKRRARTIEFVKTTDVDLRSHFVPFVANMEIDALQQILFLSGHCERHTAQINEVKADPNFPKK